MKRSLRYLLPLLLAIALIPARALSQPVNDKPADEALRQRAYKLLESLAGQTSAGEMADAISDRNCSAIVPRAFCRSNPDQLL